MTVINRKHTHTITKKVQYSDLYEESYEIEPLVVEHEHEVTANSDDLGAIMVDHFHSEYNLRVWIREAKE